MIKNTDMKRIWIGIQTAYAGSFQGAVWAWLTTSIAIAAICKGAGHHILTFGIGMVMVMAYWEENSNALKGRKIRKWMKAQEWWSEWVKETGDIRDLILTGEFGRETIMHSFSWDRSRRGFAYWHKVNADFEKWYDERF